ncbi:MAG: phage protein, partial [Solirubrobacterales bacterium]
QVFVAFGPILIEAFGEGDDVVQVEHNTPVGTTRVGVGGNAVVSVGHDRSGMVRLRLLRTADANDQLQAALVAFRRRKVFLPLLVKDTRGRELHACERAYIAEQPSNSHGQAASDVEWVINCPELSSYQGGY